MSKTVIFSSAEGTFDTLEIMKAGSLGVSLLIRNEDEKGHICLSFSDVEELISEFQLILNLSR